MFVLSLKGFPTQWSQCEIKWPGVQSIPAIKIFFLVLFLHLVIELFLREILSLYISSSGRPNLKRFLQLKLFLAKRDNPYLRKQKGKEFFIICHI
jgi:hypothetical protein